jgi:hypothetical protein
MNRFITLCLFLCATGVMMAQTTITEQHFPDSLNGSLLGQSIAFDIQTTEDGYILAGATDFPTGAIRHNLRLLKVDKDLNLIWDTTYWKGNITNMEARAIQVLPDESMLVVGFWDFSPFKMRVAANLDTVWTSQLNMQPNMINSSFETIAPTGDGHFLVGGRINSTLSFPVGILQKMTADNTILWERIFLDYLIRDIAVYEDGTFLTAGQIGFRAQIAKHQANGDTIWTKAFSFSKSDAFNDIDILDDDTILFAGEGSGFAGPIPFAGKLKPDGTLLWQAQLSNGIGKATAAEAYPSDSIAVVGSITQFWDFPGAGFFENVDASGMAIPNSFVALPDMASASAMVYDEGCMVLAGTQNGGFYIRKVCGDGINEAEEPNRGIDIRIFPQPMTTTLTVELPDQAALPAHWMLFDGAGRNVCSGSIDAHIQTLTWPNVPNGTYWLQVTKPGNWAVTKKILKQ